MDRDYFAKVFVVNSLTDVFMLQAKLMLCLIVIFIVGAFAIFRAVVLVEMLPIDANSVFVFANLFHDADVLRFSVGIAEMKHLWLWNELSLERLLELGIASETVLRKLSTVLV